jgi:hypothetical protein
MFDLLHGNLIRQMKGFELLSALLEEEFSLLVERKPDEVAALEFSIHELIRQLADERNGMGRMMNGVRLSVFAEALPDEEAAAVRDLLRTLDTVEQKCARQGSRNAELALALHDQNQEVMDFLHTRLVPPKKEQTYGRTGALNKPRAEASIFHGRL